MPQLRLLPLLTLLLSLGGCYTQSLLSDATRADPPVAERYRATWDRLPESSPDNLAGVTFQVGRQPDGAYQLHYKQGRKRELRGLETLKIGGQHYLQIRQGEAYELFRAVIGDAEVALFEPLPGCQVKNGDDRYPEVSQFRMTAECIAALGIPPGEMKLEGGVGRVLFQGRPEAAIRLLERYGERMYGEKRLVLKAQ